MTGLVDYTEYDRNICMNIYGDGCAVQHYRLPVFWIIYYKNQFHLSNDHSLLRSGVENTCVLLIL